MIDLHDALSRTALLVRRDVFPQLTSMMITEHLLGRRVRLISDDANLASPAGQTAVVASAIALAQTGARVTLDIPDVALAGVQPPIAPGRTLLRGLTEVLDDLLQPAGLTCGHPVDIDVVFGDAIDTGPAAPVVLRVCGDGYETHLRCDGRVSGRWTGSAPFGGLLAGVAVSAEAFRAALADLATSSGVQPLGEHAIGAPQNVRLVLDPLDERAILELGDVDMISGGAITNSALAALLRIDGLRARLRIIDDDPGAASNLNRYALLRASVLGVPKVEVLAQLATPAITIAPLVARFDTATLDQIVPLAPSVLVGVDDIPSRWLVARHAPGWSCVAGTGRMEIVVSEHVPGGPCAGCMHPYDDQDSGLIPTVSFVSQLAGILQAHRLLRHARGLGPAAPVIAYGLGLNGPRPLFALGQTPRHDCPAGCSAARRAA